MSKGIGAHARLLMVDDTLVVYEYGAYNLNDPIYRNEHHVYDGYITIHRNCFAEPKIHSAIKRMSGGRKQIIKKRVPVTVNYPEMIANGQIEIQNCSHCWRTSGGKNVDVMVLHLLFKIFSLYQEEGCIPQNVSYFV